MTGDILGILRHMSPEQAAGDRAKIDYRTDIYSLGITLYELLTGQPAFTDTDRHVLLRRIIEDEPRSPRSTDAAIPRDLETIVLTATAKEHTDRFASMAALAGDLRCFLESRPVQAKRQNVLQRTSRWLRQHHLAVATATAFVVVVAIIQGFALTRESRLRGEAEGQRERAETNEQLAWDVTFNLLTPLTLGWEQLPKSYTLQRQALDEAIDAHRTITAASKDANTASVRNFTRLLLLRADNSFQLGESMEEDGERAISLLEPLVAAEPESRELRELLAEAYGVRGGSLYLELRFLEATVAYSKSRE
jgi:serine/threonine protein kinase